MSIATETRCNGCGAGISEWEEGRCAYCRAEDRGDDQLLAHDSRGYLDVDGKTRIPCGCGCQKPVIVPEPEPAPDPADDIEQLRDLIGHGQKVEIRLPQEPVSWRREWIEGLGGVIVIDPSAPMPLAMQRDKEEPNGNGHADVPPKPQERTEPMSEQLGGKRKWTRESVIETIQAFAREHGRPPMMSDFAGGKGPSAPTAIRIFGSWGDAVVAAGFPRPQRGKVPQALSTPAPPLLEQEPEPIAPEPESEPEPEPKPTAALVPVPAAPPPIANGSDPESVDVFELFEHMATDERIDYYEAVAAQAQLKAEALRSIREALETVKGVEA